MPWFFIVGFIITFQLWEMNNSKTTSLSREHMLQNNSVVNIKQDIMAKIKNIQIAQDTSNEAKKQCVNGGCCCSSLENCRCSKCNNNDNNDENYKQIIKMCENNGVFVRARFYNELKLANKNKNII